MVLISEINVSQGIYYINIQEFRFKVYLVYSKIKILNLIIVKEELYILYYYVM